MKWSDLTLKERKQIYDAVRAENPNTSYFDIKSQFDSIPEYEDGIMLTNTDKGYVDWKSKLASNLKNETYGYDLYGAYKSGAQQQLEDDGYYHLPTRDPKTNKILKYPSHNTFWLGITEDIKQGYYPQVKDGRPYTVPVYEDGSKKIVPPRELGLTPGTPEYYKRQQQISGRAELVQPEAYVTPADKKTYELVKGIDTAYGTDYLDAYKRIAARDMTNRGKYIKYAELPGNKNAKISRVRDVQDYGPVVDDYVITIDPLQYLPGTANHELGHLADQLASDANNRYLTYLLDEGNIMGPGELRNKGININPNMQAYLLDPSESKSHMLHLKRALVNEGKIHDWSSKVNQNTIEDFLFDPRNTGVVNNANKLQYNMYRNKSRFVDRINNLTPMEFITPLLLPVAGYEINKE